MSKSPKTFKGTPSVLYSQLFYETILIIMLHSLHKLSEYVNGEAFTNSIEGFWSLVKRRLIGIYHFTSKNHLQIYLDEFVFRFNTRYYSETDRFDRLLTNMTVRTSYRDLIAA